MSRLTRDGTAEPVSRDQIPRHLRGQGNVHFPCSADHEQDWQPYPVDPYSAICDDHTYIHTANRDRASLEFIRPRDCAPMPFTAESPPAEPVVFKVVRVTEISYLSNPEDQITRAPHLPDGMHYSTLRT